VQGVGHRHADDEDAGFVQSDLDLAAGMAAVAAMALQNARMHAESLRQQRHQQDLRLAQQLQKSFLPRRLPDVAGLEFHAEYLPTHSVGGDFYDLFRLDERRIAVVLGDVAGKGVSAALLMAGISSDLRVAALAEVGPSQVLARLNRMLLEREQHEVFVTCIYATIDVETSAAGPAATRGNPP
jgi:serine phosphatase RsbU (regulator of sigma subunit)